LSLAVALALALAHLHWAKLHALQGAILIVSLAVAYLGVVLATGGLPRPTADSS
jgi:hypothetical protein